MHRSFYIPLENDGNAKALVLVRPWKIDERMNIKAFALPWRVSINRYLRTTFPLPFILRKERERGRKDGGHIFDIGPDKDKGFSKYYSREH